MEFYDDNKKSSSVAKAGLATGITGTALGAMNALGGLGSILAGVANNNGGCYQGPVAYNAGCCCNEDHLVTRYDAAKDHEIMELNNKLALKDSEIYTDKKSLEMFAYIDGKLSGINKSLCDQAVLNQANKDSMQILQERMDNDKHHLEDLVQRECERRECADNAIVSYVNCTFVPNETVGYTADPEKMTLMKTRNPLPNQKCGSCC